MPWERAEDLAGTVAAPVRRPSGHPRDTENPLLVQMGETCSVGLGWFDLETRRKDLAMLYAWAVPNDKALDAIAECGPIVEIGSGSGYWASLLGARGVDVVAYDREPPGSALENPEWYGDVRAFFPARRGDADSAGDHPDRTLLLCWPPYDQRMAADALASFRAAGGRRCIYIGEPTGGLCGNDQFFELLEDWKRVRTVDIPQWPGYSDTLTIYEAPRTPV